jgi:hypothetical protein
MKERTYRYFHGKPLYSFGSGLTHARFVYSNLQPGTRSLGLGQSQAVDVGESKSGLARELGISRDTVYRYPAVAPPRKVTPKPPLKPRGGEL